METTCLVVKIELMALSICIFLILHASNFPDFPPDHNRTVLATLNS